MELAGRQALVTGSSSGIGRAVGLALAEAGAAVCLVGRDRARLDAAVAAARERAPCSAAERVLGVAADLVREEDAARLAATLREAWGGIGILVHSAGAYGRGAIETASAAEFDALYAANVRAPYRLTQLLLPSLKERRGDVVFVNSTQGLAPSPGVGQFAATQHALRALADTLRGEVNEAGVRVLTIHLGRTATPRQAKVYEAEGRPYAPERLVQPEDVAAVVLAALRLPRTAEITTLSMRSTLKP
jgi:NAD(P)-dependent dehydrogenase (short-subunit alcohol dehydrogenase family)